MRRRLLSCLLVGSAVLAGCSVGQGVTATKSQSATGGTSPTRTTSPSADQPATTDSTNGTNGTTGTRPNDTTEPTTAPTAATTTPGSTAPLTVPPNQQVIGFGDHKTERPYDGFLVAAFSDIEKFWGTQFPATYGKPFTPLKGGIFAAHQARTSPIPGCGTAQTTYADVEGNAFYCDQGDFIVYDDDKLLPELVKNLGESSVGVVLAHEFGHAIQERAGEFGQPTILKEQQADCFAGAWAAHVARGEAAGLTIADREIKQGLIAMIQVRDPLSGNVNDPNAHGSGFDRVGAFQDGFNGGTTRCKTFFTEGREKNLIDIPFDPRNPTGNLPFQDPTGAGGDIVTLIPKDLDRFWTATLNGITKAPFVPPKLVLFPEAGPYPACDGVDQSTFKVNVLYCTSTNSVLVDQDFGARLDANPVFGDLSVGYLIGDAYSQAVQAALNSPLTGKQRVLADDCFTGAWVASAIPPLPADRANDPTAISLSAGDLDEAVVTALSRSDVTADENLRGTAFEKVASFRSGVLGGFAECRKLLG